MTNLMRCVYNPSGYSFITEVMLTEEQAKVLNSYFEVDEFYASFWAEKVGSLNNGDRTLRNTKVARINGNHYHLETDGGSGIKGMGGRKHFIHFTSGPHKGDIVECTNLWHQGEIPSNLLPLLPDNAEFIREQEAKQLQETEEEKIIHHLMDEFSAEFIADGECWEKKGKEIIKLYNKGTEAQKDIINTLFIHLCGWSLETLKKKAKERHDEK